jgi:pantothenate kinase
MDEGTKVLSAFVFTVGILICRMRMQSLDLDESKTSAVRTTTSEKRDKLLVTTSESNPNFLSPEKVELRAASSLLERISSCSSDEAGSRKRPLVIGIAGGTASGKTTLAQAIYKALGPENIIYITHDCYYRDLSHLSMKEREVANFDHPDSLDTQLLIQHVKDLKNLKPVRIPAYDYSTHSRLPGLTEVSRA